MAEAGIGVYVGGGGSGEGFVLTPDERRRILEIAAEELGGKVPFRSMGVETRSAEEMIEYLRVAASAGVDAAQIYSLDLGHGHVPTQAEILEYLIDVLSATTVPAVLSTHQSVGYRISVESIARVVERFDHVVGVNSSHADLAYLSAIVDAVGEQGRGARRRSAAGIDRARAGRERLPELRGQPRAPPLQGGDRRVRGRIGRRIVRGRSAGSRACRSRCTAAAGSGRRKRC